MDNESLNKTLAELREAQQAAQDSLRKESTEWWEGLSTEDQQLAFYTVMSKVFQYRVQEGRSYRGTLYDGFGWGGEAYGLGMECGFFALHNMIHDALELEAMNGVTRFEVIDDTGRAYTKYLKEGEGIKFGLQDDDRTLKVFIDDKRWKEDL